MCPDIEAFAPLIHATFGAAEGFDGAPTALTRSARPTAASPGAVAGPTRVDLRVRLADRSLRQTNPVLGVVAELLALASARVTAAQVLDLAGREPVRRRFRFDDDDLARAEEWVAAAGVRWGLDAAHRAPLQARRPRRQHLAGRPRPAPARRGHGRRGAPARRRGAARSTT